MDDYSMETKYEIWSNVTGEYLEVGPDRDGLDFVEIRSYDSDSKLNARLTITKEQAVLVADALKRASE